MRIRLVTAAMAALSFVAASDAGDRAWYASIEGGVSYADVPIPQTKFLCPGSSILSIPVDVCVADDTVSSGGAVIGAIGAHLGKDFRVEGEIGYRSNEVGTFDTLSHTTLMLNGAWDVPLTEGLSLSLGAGLGIDRLSSSELNTYVPIADSDVTAFAYQGIAGLSYALSDRIAITASYRHLETSMENPLSLITHIKQLPPSSGSPLLGSLGISPAVAPDKVVTQVDDVSADTVSVGLRISF